MMRLNLEHFIVLVHSLAEKPWLTARRFNGGSCLFWYLSLSFEAQSLFDLGNGIGAIPYLNANVHGALPTAARCLYRHCLQVYTTRG
jgi:hypothetical protein